MVGGVIRVDVNGNRSEKRAVKAGLVERAKQGDVAGYGELVWQYQDLAFRVAYLVTGDPAEAEDVAQEAFVKAYCALDQFEPGAEFRPWLLQIVTNEALNRRRTDQRRVNLEQRAAGTHLSQPPFVSPEENVLATEQRELIDRALSDLNDMDRIVLTYRYFVELSVAEMAGILGCTESTIRTRLSRALGRFRDRMTGTEEHGSEEPRHG